MTHVSPYPRWKIQYYDGMSLCWKEVPKSFQKQAEAEVWARRFGTVRVRLVRIEARGKRVPLPETEKGGGERA